MRPFKLPEPRKWLRPTDHSVDCFFCLADVHRGRSKAFTKSSISTTASHEEGECSYISHSEPIEDEIDGSVQECKHSSDDFCFVCGLWIKGVKKRYAVGSSAIFQQAYKEYFKKCVVDLDKPWVPRFSCCSCYNTLTCKYFILPQ